MHFRSQTWLQLLVLFFATSCLAVDTRKRTVTNDFSDYPSGAQQCLYDASDDSGCDGDTVAEMNKCLCGNGGDFVTNSAKCVAEEDSDDMESTYTTLNQHCSDSNTPLSISKKEWMAEESSISSSTTSTKTASETTSNTESTGTATTISTGQSAATTTVASPSLTSTPAPDNRSALSTGAKVGIIVGSAAAGVAFLGVALFFLCRYRRRRTHAYDEVHPVEGQLPPNHGSVGFAMSGPAGSETAHPSRSSIAPSDSEFASDPRKSWLPSSDGSLVPWSPGAFEVVKLHPGLGSIHQPPPPDVYEMSTDSERPTSVSPPMAAFEMPVIAVTSPTVSPTSRYSGADWSSHVDEEPSRYEPYRPSR